MLKMYLKCSTQHLLTNRNYIIDNLISAARYYFGQHPMRTGNIPYEQNKLTLESESVTTR